MKNQTMCIVVAASVLLIANGSAFADASNASSNLGGGMASSGETPKDTRTDRSLTEVKDSKWNNQSVTNTQGEKVGKVAKMLRDEKTQKIEYAMIEIRDTQHARPMLWSRFEEREDKLVLNATKEELMPSVSQKDSKDISPDLAIYMNEIEKKRAEHKPKVGAGMDAVRIFRCPSTGEMGEDSAAGNLGPRGASPGDAPGYEGEGKKR